MSISISTDADVMKVRTALGYMSTIPNLDRQSARASAALDRIEKRLTESALDYSVPQDRVIAASDDDGRAVWKALALLEVFREPRRVAEYALDRILRDRDTAQQGYADAMAKVQFLEHERDKFFARIEKRLTLQPQVEAPQKPKSDRQVEATAFEAVYDILKDNLTIKIGRSGAGGDWLTVSLVLQDPEGEPVVISESKVLT